MKNFKFLKYTFTFVGLFIFGIFNYLFANSEYYYKNLTVNADIQQDGTIEVNEVFDAYFNVPKHGIIRNIPLKYTIDGKRFRIFLEDIRVDGRNASVYDGNGEKEIKIGDANREIVGEQRYSIHYSVYGLIRNFAGKGREELSWNVIPNGFDTHIDHVRIELQLPKSYTGFTSEDVLVAADGKSNKVEDFEGTIDRSQGDKIILTYDKTISAGNGITIAMKFPVGYFEFDHERQESLIDNGNIIQRNLSNGGQNKGNQMSIDTFGMVFIAVILLIIFIPRITPNIHTKNFYKGKYPVIVQYEPPQGLNSAEVGLIYHRSPQMKDMLSLLYERLSNRNISLYKKEKNGHYLIINKLQEIQTSKTFEQSFFNDFLPWRVNTFDQLHYKFLHLDDLKEYGINQGWFTGKTVAKFGYAELVAIIMVIMIILGTLYALSIIPQEREGILKIILIIGGVSLLFGFSLVSSENPIYQLTEVGEKLYTHILGYKEFLLTVDEDRLKLYLERDPNYIEKILAYAIVFGIETELIKKLQKIALDKELLNHISNFETLNHNINYSNPVVHNSSSSYDSSSGFSSGSSFRGSSSGSSGGGGGGGGGRSW